ncbi:hypothetical protein ABZX34_07465 [Streptomyces sp. NPDC004362]|uniref:hypothetical protein n=1 Tax=Streptomyces sp. NPDC004362 TaxID=3154456 RepID=UPI0033ABAF91
MSPVAARLVATLTAPLSASEAQAPELSRPAGRTALLQRGDREALWVPLDDSYALGTSEEASVRFPAPWPQRRGTWAVAPDGSLAVFAGVHAVRAVEPSGTVRWEIRHGCWHGACLEMHESYEEYADRPDHKYPERGSAGFSSDGRLVWAHVRGPLPEGELEDGVIDEWLIISADDGRVLARVDACAAAAGSEHLAHPDPGQMGLSIGEGQDGAPLRWGRWDGRTLAVNYFDGQDLVLIGLNPSGERFMTVSHDQGTLAVHDTADGSALTQWDVESDVPRHPEAEPENDEVWAAWDWAGGFLDETTLIAGTVESDEEWGVGRHWLLSTGQQTPEQITYPLPVTSAAQALADGTWYTYATSDFGAMHIWTRA